MLFEYTTATYPQFSTKYSGDREINHKIGYSKEGRKSVYKINGGEK